MNFKLCWMKATSLQLLKLQKMLVLFYKTTTKSSVMLIKWIYSPQNYFSKYLSKSYLLYYAENI